MLIQHTNKPTKSMPKYVCFLLLFFLQPPSLLTTPDVVECIAGPQSTATLQDTIIAMTSSHVRNVSRITSGGLRREARTLHFELEAHCHETRSPASHMKARMLFVHSRDSVVLSKRQALRNSISRSVWIMCMFWWKRGKDEMVREKLTERARTCEKERRRENAKTTHIQVQNYNKNKILPVISLRYTLVTQSILCYVFFTCVATVYH